MIWNYNLELFINSDMGTYVQNTSDMPLVI